MRKELYLIRLGEICLKGNNRDYFERKLKQNLKYKLKGYKTKFTKQKGRFFLVAENIPEEIVNETLATTFGIVGFSKAIRTEKNFEEIKKSVLELLSKGNTIQEIQNFKVETKRADKSFPMISYEVSAEIGGIILDTYPHLKVNVKTPQLTIHVEIRDKAYVYAASEKGPGGLPVGCAGKGLLLLSGGIDSPVAGYRMAKRGLRQDAIYFHTYPYTSDEAKDKVITLAKIINPYLSGLRLFIIPFTECQLRILERGKAEQSTLLMRYSMVYISNIIAKNSRAKCLVTGESLSQVASQTLESITYTESASNIPIFRPLIGLDKEEIIITAKNIGTYETSILPFEDCCTIFSPKHPLVKPEKDELITAFNDLEIEELLEKAALSAEIISLRTK